MCLFWTQRKIFWRMWETSVLGHHWLPLYIFFPTMEVNGAPELLFPTFFRISSFVFGRTKIFLYRFGNTWGWVNDDRIFGWTIPLTPSKWNSRVKNRKIPCSRDIINTFTFCHLADTYIKSKLWQWKQSKSTKVQWYGSAITPLSFTQNM